MDRSAARLEVVAGNAAGMWIVVEDELLIGRHTEGAGRLADDEEISRSHARVSVDASGFCAIEDLGSTNGTLVNGLRISAQQTLSEGDTIEIGGTTLVVRELPVTATAQTASPATLQPTVAPAPAVQAAAGSRPEEAPGPVAREPQGVTPPALREPATLAFRLEVDFVGHEARIVLDDSSEPVRLVFDAGAWRRASPQA